MVIKFVYFIVVYVRDPTQENVMNAHRKSVYSFLWLINLKKITIVSTRQIIIQTLQRQYSRWNKDNIKIHYPGSYVLCWAGCKSPLHFPGLSFLKAASKLNPYYPRQIRRGVDAQSGGGQIPAPYWPNRIHLHNTSSLLHSTLSITVHFNGSNGTAYIRPLSVCYSLDI